MAPWILGINGSHNGSYCLLRGNRVRVAIQEERLVGCKRARVYGGRRGLGLQYCLGTAGIKASDLSMVVLSSQTHSRDEENDLRLNPELRDLGGVPMRVVSHHLAHAASALAMSGYETAAVLVADGFGSPVEDLDPAAKRSVIDQQEEGSEHLSLFHARGGILTPLEIHTAANWVEKVPSGMWRFFTLGGMFTAVAQQIFGDANAAGKVMGLAPYGDPTIPAQEFLVFDGDRLFFPNLVQRRYRDQSRWPRNERAYRELACSTQQVLESAMIRLSVRLREMTGEHRLCLAGGVALNSVANQRICLEAGFSQIDIIPAAEDSGVALGAAYLGLWELEGYRPGPQARSDAWGRTAASGEIEEAIRAAPDIQARRPADLLGEVADRLRRGEIGGWYQAGAELGPRALGQRSILCSPCRPDAKEQLNARVKFREAFRPFAPSVLADHAADWFDFGASTADSPFMLRVVPFREGVRHRVPAVVHVDGTGRVQSLTPEDNGPFYRLVARFHELTGVPMLLNTSMNVRGEPIVETPTDALWCLLGTELDFCVLHDWLVTKREAFRSVLDYVPVVVADGYTLRLGVADGALETAIRREDAATVQTTTPWGRVDVVLPIRLLPLLSRVDGRRDGRALRRSLEGEATAIDVACDLLLLRRMRVIEFRQYEPRDR